MRLPLPPSRAAFLWFTLALAVPVRAEPAGLDLAQAAVTEERSAFNLSRLGLAQLAAGQPDAAEKTAAELDRLAPAETQTLTLRAEIALARGQTAAAFNLLDEAVRAHPDDSEAFANRGRVRFELRRNDLGRDDFDRAIELSSGYDTRSLLLRSQLRTQDQDLAGAAQDLSRILRLEPGRTDLLTRRVPLYLSLQLRRLSLADLDALREQTPADPALPGLRVRAEALPEADPAEVARQITGLLRQSAAALVKPDLPAAARAFNQAVLASANRDPEAAPEPALYVERGDLLLAAGQTQRAREDFGQALYGDQLVPPALLRLARLDFADKEFSLALARINSIDPALGVQDAAEGWLLGARAQLALAVESPESDALIEAFKALQTARLLNPSLPELAAVRQELVTARRQAGAAALARLQDVDASLAFAREEAGRDHPKAAFALYERLLRLHPGNPAIYEARLATAKDLGINNAQAGVDRAIAAELRSPAPAVPKTGSEADLALARADLAVHLRPYLSTPYIERARLRLRRAAGAVNQQTGQAEIAAAQKDARFAAELDPADPQAAVAVSEVLVAQRDTVDILNLPARLELLRQAAAAGDRALALAPDDVALILWRGDLERDYGPDVLVCDSESLRLYARACRADPRSTRALLAHAQAAMKVGRPTDAVADYGRILQLEPANHYARYELGVAQLFAGGYTEASATFSSLQQILALAGDRTSADAVETAQLRAITLAAAGDNAFEPIAQEVLARSHWIGNADVALQSLVQLTPHAPQIDRLRAMKETRNPALPGFRENQQSLPLDAAPR